MPDDGIDISPEWAAQIRARHDATRWVVEVGTVDGSVHVQPVKGMLELEYGGSYPRTRRGVERAIRRWQRWCDRKNRALDRAQRIAEEFNRG